MRKLSILTLVMILAASAVGCTCGRTNQCRSSGSESWRPRSLFGMGQQEQCCESPVAAPMMMQEQQSCCQ
jgi:hypothetical protein